MDLMSMLKGGGDASSAVQALLNERAHNDQKSRAIHAAQVSHGNYEVRENFRPSNVFHVRDATAKNKTQELSMDFSLPSGIRFCRFYFNKADMASWLLVQLTIGAWQANITPGVAGPLVAFETDLDHADALAPFVLAKTKETIECNLTLVSLADANIFGGMSIGVVDYRRACALTEQTKPAENNTGLHLLTGGIPGLVRSIIGDHGVSAITEMKNNMRLAPPNFGPPR